MLATGYMPARSTNPQEDEVLRKPFRQNGHIHYRILKALRDGGKDFRKTPLSHAADVNYTVLLWYLSDMNEDGSVTIKPDDEGHDIVRITSHGLDVLAGLEIWIQAHEKDHHNFNANSPASSNTPFGRSPQEGTDTTNLEALDGQKKPDKPLLNP
jgi:predicted transcriptional regulator